MSIDFIDPSVIMVTPSFKKSSNLKFPIKVVVFQIKFKKKNLHSGDFVRCKVKEATAVPVI